MLKKSTPSDCNGLIYALKYKANLVMSKGKNDKFL